MLADRIQEHIENTEAPRDPHGRYLLLRSLEHIKDLEADIEGLQVSLASLIDELIRDKEAEAND